MGDREWPNAVSKPRPTVVVADEPARLAGLFSKQARIDLTFSINKPALCSCTFDRDPDMQIDWILSVGSLRCTDS